jgi:predicted acyl esterase
VAPATNLDNSVIPYYFEREVRRWARDIKAATFMFHGFGDGIVPPTYQSGLFDRIDAPKTGLFGWWWHETPAPEDRYTAIGADWARPDFYPMVLAWFDHHLMGIDNGVEGWPVAQVQDNTGQWRAEANWPATDGSQGQLLLGDGGLLGDLVPQDGARSSYTEEIVPFDRDSELNDPGTEVLFTTEPLTDPLHITGRPVLDLWMILDKPDAHVAVELETFDADGNPLDAPFSAGNGVVFGARSMQHNDAFVDGLFLQDTAQPAPMGSPFQTQIRLDTVDLVIPEGGFMRLRIAGSARWGPGLEPPEAPTIFQHPTVTSGSATNVTILHDCNFISALRFEMPSKHPDFLNVREIDEEGATLTPAPVHGRPQTTDGGIATDRVCGKQRGGPDGSFGAEIKSAR